MSFTIYNFRTCIISKARPFVNRFCGKYTTQNIKKSRPLKVCSYLYTAMRSPQLSYDRMCRYRARSACKRSDGKCGGIIGRHQRVKISKSENAYYIILLHNPPLYIKTRPSHGQKRPALKPQFKDNIVIYHKVILKCTNNRLKPKR